MILSPVGKPLVEKLSCGIASCGMKVMWDDVLQDNGLRDMLFRTVWRSEGSNT